MIKRPFAVVVLASGGDFIPLTPYRGRTLVEHSALTAILSGASEVVVVAGAEHEEIRRRLRWLPVKIVHNREWREGLSSFIRCGISAISDEPEVAALTLCGQFAVTPVHLRALAREVLPGMPIAASAYDGVAGVPAAFDRSLFGALLSLEGPSGARNLIRDSAIAIEIVPFERGNDRPARICHPRIQPVSTSGPLAKVSRLPFPPRAPPSTSSFFLAA